MDASQITLTVWCAYPEQGFYSRPWRLMAWANLLMAVLHAPSHGSLASAAWVLGTLTLETVHVVRLSFAADALYDANSFTLPAVLVSFMYALVLALLYPRKVTDSYITTKAVSVPVYVFGFACIFVQHILFPVMWNFENTLLRAQCDADGKCANPCPALSKSLTRESMLQPVIWTPTSPQDLSRFTTPANEWIRNAAKVDTAAYEYLRSLPLKFFLLGLIVYTVQTNVGISPRDARNRIFQSLQESHQPVDNGQPRIKYYGRWFLLKLRYVRFIIKPLSLALQVKLALYTALKGAAEARKKGKKRQPPADYVVVPCRSSFRHAFGKRVAATWYLWATSLYVLLPIYAAILIIRTELSLSWLPNYAPQQWLPTWVPLIIIGVTLLAEVVPVLERRLKGDKAVTDASVTEETFDSGSLLYIGPAADSNLPLHRRLAAVAKSEWREFLRWWRNPEQASSSMDAAKRVEDGENGGYNIELKGWTHQEGVSPTTLRASNKPFGS